MSRPLIAILRGITPAESPKVARSLLDAGIDRIEVTLNSPSPYDSISAIRDAVGEHAQVGAGTVTAVDEVEKVRWAGAEFVVSPNTDTRVIQATKASGMQSIPGVLTPSECFAAIAAGADGLKFFPSSVLGVTGLKSVRAVLPPAIQLFVVGGIDRDNINEWLRAGADGFGLGTSLYTPGRAPGSLFEAAAGIVDAFDKARC